MAGSGEPDEEAGEARDIVGLALSGGGFRAAVFHVGVLARLAELGYLQKVEVISTVSGGSIVGSLYYLLLKDELEREPDGPIDYLAIVAEVEVRLREAVRTNIRAQVFARPFTTMRMALRDYSRSHRIGELYDSHLYRSGAGDGEPVKLRDLRVCPPDAEGKPRLRFNPERHNRRRINKVPILMINATTLNTGHPWRFEAIRMGEPFPEAGDVAATLRDIDKNKRFQQGYFEDPPAGTSKGGEERVQFRDEALQDFPLGIAVAASAGVPGVFQPVTIRNAYKDINVQLVDGGVLDNLGVSGLLDRRCTHLIVSDASGQMEDVDKPSTRIPPVVSRSLVIPRDGIREEQLLRAFGDSSAEEDLLRDFGYSTRKVAVMHLRKGLEARAVPPVGGGAPTEDLKRPQELASREFGVDEEVQLALSQIRTDLDYFNRLEASSLELDGYLMTRLMFERQSGWERILPGGEGSATGSWCFHEAGELIGTSTPAYLKVLREGRVKFLRWLPKPMRWLLLGVAALVALALVYLLMSRLGDLAAGIVAVGALVVAALYVIDLTISRWFFTAAGWVVIPMLAFPLALGARVQLLLRELLRWRDRRPFPDPEPTPGE